MAGRREAMYWEFVSSDLAEEDLGADGDEFGAHGRRI